MAGTETDTSRQPRDLPPLLPIPFHNAQVVYDRSLASQEAVLTTLTEDMRRWALFRVLKFVLWLSSVFV